MACKTFGPLKSSLAQSQDQCPKLFFNVLYCFFHQQHMSLPEVIPPTTRVINTQIFLLLSQISQLLLNQSPCSAFHISCIACKIIPKFPLTALGLLLCAVDHYERVSGGSKGHEKCKRNGSSI